MIFQFLVQQIKKYVILLLYNYYTKIDFLECSEIWSVLIIKANEMHYFSNLCIHYINAIGICHASSVGCLLTDSQQCVYSVEILLMMDSGLV